MAALTTTVHANLYEFSEDLCNERLDRNNTTSGGSFYIIPPYTPGAETIDWATLDIRILNPDGVADHVYMSFGDLSDTVKGRTFTLSGDIEGSALATLRADGILEYSITFVGNLLYPNSYFLLDEAFLLVSTTPNSTGQVPDGGTTVGLLGVAMIGLEWGRRKLTASRSKN
jgi:hypothetical protein